MSDDAPAPMEQAAEGDPGSAGQVESPPTQSEAPPPEPTGPDYLDITDDLRSKHVRVKVDGEEISVPLDEALQGYQRQAAFTQHSQQLAEQRREAEEAIRLHQAMRANPGLTVQILADHAGMSVQEYLGMQAAQAAQQQAEAEPEFDDPLERELYHERQAREALERRVTQREADEQLRYAVMGLQQQYGLNDEQIRAVVGTAMQMNLGIDYLPMVYQAMAFQAQQAAQAQAAQQRATEEQERQAAAANAAALVGSGTSANGVTSTPATSDFSSYREAIEAAYDEVERRQRR